MPVLNDPLVGLYDHHPAHAPRAIASKLVTIEATFGHYALLGSQIDREDAAYLPLSGMPVLNTPYQYRTGGEVWCSRSRFFPSGGALVVMLAQI